MSSLERIVRAPWQDAAACNGETGVLFYPPLRAERKATRIRREARALAVCEQCTVREECLEDAIAHNERYGIWGGLTDRERRALIAASELGKPRPGDTNVVTPPGDAAAVEF